MSVEKTSENQARYLAAKRTEVQKEEAALQIEKGKALRAREKAAAAELDKTDKTLVAISKAGEAQAEAAKKLNTERVHQLNQAQQKTYLKIAENAAEQIKTMRGEATRIIDDTRMNAAERIRFVEDASDDPFYRIKTLRPHLEENLADFKIYVPLPEHEAKNLMIAGEGTSVKLSLSRRFEESVKATDGSGATKTNSFQTVVESVAMPGAFNPKKITREYVDGNVIVTIPRDNLFPTSGNA
jgi:HSP20 family molecular chaperone IbpA